MSKQIGLPGMPVSTRSGWNNTQGDFVEQVFEGSQSYIEGLYASVRGNCAECHKEHDGPRWRLNVRFANEPEGQGETPEREIRLSANRTHKALETHPNYSDITDEERREINQAIEENAEPEADWGDAAVELYEKLLARHDSYIFEPPVLIITDTASLGFNFGAWDDYYNNVGRIFSSNLLQNIADAPIPPGLPLGGELGSAPDGFVYGWYKHFPDYIESTTGKSQVQQEWEYGLWDQDTYGDLIG